MEPLLMDDEFLKRLGKLDKICHHFHLSLQSGCNETLKRMNRRYTIEQFEDIVQNLRKCYPDVILTTDIIVGFPGETEEEFRKTYEFLKKIKFYKMHVFKYSIRSGTRAAIMENQISSNKKDARSKEFIKLSEENQNFYHNQYIGQELEVLIEEKEGNFYKGHTPNYLLVEIEAKEDLKLENQVVLVKICEIMENSVLGKLVTQM